MKIYFDSYANPVRDAQIEAVFQDLKNSEEPIRLSNRLLLKRFQLAVKYGEIEPFYLTVVDQHNKKQETKVNNEGVFLNPDIFSSPFARLNEGYDKKLNESN